MLSARARPRFRPPLPTLALAAAACALGAACSSPAELHGSPILTQVYWIAGGQQLLAWSLQPDPTMVSPVPPFASEVDFVFDRRLDGARIEDVVTVGGVPMTHPKDPPAVRVTWPDMATVMSTPPFHAVADYNSLPRYGGVSSYVYAHPDVPGFPASDTLTFELVPELLAGPYGDPAALPTPPSILIKTSALTVSIASSASVVRSYQLPLTFSNTTTGLFPAWSSSNTSAVDSKRRSIGWRIRSTGAQIRMQSPLIRRINDDAKTWARLVAQVDEVLAGNE